MSRNGLGHVRTAAAVARVQAVFAIFIGSYNVYDGLLMNFLEARYISRMTTKEVADYLEISHRTILRYEKSGKAPKSVIECLLMIGGLCPTFSRRNDFSGWSFGSGFLWSPEGDKFTSGDVRAGQHALLQVNAEYRNKIRQQQALKSGLISNVIIFPLNICK